MSGINPYGSFILQGLYGRQSSAASNFPVQTAQLTNIPTTLKNLATNLILKGEVTSNKQNGEAIIATNRGDITVKLQNQLPVGARVDIQISSGQNTREVIVQPTLVKAIQQKQDSQTVQAQVQTQQPQTASTATIADVKNLQATATQASQNITNILSNLTVGQSVRITPLPVAQQNILGLQNFKIPTQLQTITTSVTPLTNGTTIQLPISSTGQNAISLPTTQTATAPISSTPPTSPQLLAGNAFVNQTQISPTPQTLSLIASPPIPQGISTSNNPHHIQQIDARIFALTPPAVSMTSSTNNQLTLTDTPIKAGQIFAVATGFVNADGNPIIQTIGANNQVQLSTLHYPARNVPAGTQIILTPMPSGTIATPQIQSWQAMTQLTETMAQIFPANAMQSLMALLPNPAQPKTFPAAALLFLAAAKGGDLSGWLGTRITRGGDDTTAQMPKKLIDTLMRDIATQTGRSATPSDPPMVQSNPDWRAHVLPLMVGTDMQQVNLWTKDEQSKQEKDDVRNKGTRFIVDLTLSRMGDVYFDGFINKDKKIFDLAVITERAITKPMQNTIKSIWYNTITSLDLDGTIIFKENT